MVHSQFFEERRWSQVVKFSSNNIEQAKTNVGRFGLLPEHDYFNPFTRRTIMCRELIYLICLVFVLGLAGGVATADPYQQDTGPDGIVSIEAENFDENTPYNIHEWIFVTEPAGFSGEGAMQNTPADPLTGGGPDTNYADSSPRLDFEVNFVKTGTYYIWIRGYGQDGNSDSCHAGINGEAVESGHRFWGFGTSYIWVNTTNYDPPRRTVDVPSAGVHTINVWMREDAFVCDKIVLTTNPDYTPTGSGPPESWRGARLKAYNPSPADGSLYLDTWATLSWMAGDTAVSHDVYIGENSADVNDGAADTFRGNNAMAFSVAGFPGYPYPDGLVPGTTYYWRVDEVESDELKHKGDVWSFTVPPKTAYDPTPPDNTRFVTTDTTLNWKGGLKTKLHYVYFGNDFDAVNNAAGAPPQADTTYIPATLELDAVYYWRVDVFDGAILHKGDVWSFRTLPEITVTDPNLVGWWKLDTTSGITAIDWSGHGNNGTIEGDPQWVEGFDGGAIAFNGNDYIELPTDMVGSDVGSVTMWIKTEQTNVGMILYGSDGTSGNGYGDENEMHVNIDSGGIVELFIEFGDSDVSAETPAVNNNSWHHIAATWDINGQVMLYLNGGEPVSADHTGNDFRFSGRIRLGAPNSSQRFYIGSLDDVRLYDRVLSVAEINEAMRGDPLLAWKANPSNGARPNIKDATPLTWSPGDKASEHDVYFGIDKAAVADANTSTADIYRGRQSATSYTPPEGVEWGGGPYYWRIDQYNTDGTISKGRIWSFTVADFILVEDFESYDAVDNQIWYAWHDGLGYGAPGTDPYFAGNGTGAAVGDESTASYTEESIVHGGNQSMPLSYDNNKQGYSKYSEAELKLTAPRDWTEGAVGELSLWFRGNPGSVGSFTEAPVGTYTMTGGGADIWSDADEFHFAFKTLTGPGTIIAKVESVENTNAWAKAGVMIRETLDPGSKFAAVYIMPTNADGTPTQGCRIQARTDTDIDATSDTSVATPEQMAITAPYWIKLERDVSGNFRGYYSANGTTWQGMVWRPTITMSSNIYVGLALTSHDAALTCEAVFSNVMITGTAGLQWANQDIGIVSNAPEPLYVALSNSAGTPAVVVHNDPAAATIDTWTEWVIPLQSFADQGINLGNIDRIAIGLGTKGDITTPGGSGKMFFDDIRLYHLREAAE